MSYSCLISTRVLLATIWGGGVHKQRVHSVVLPNKTKNRAIDWLSSHLCKWWMLLCVCFHDKKRKENWKSLLISFAMKKIRRREKTIQWLQPIIVQQLSCSHHLCQAPCMLGSTGCTEMWYCRCIQNNIRRHGMQAQELSSATCPPCGCWPSAGEHNTAASAIMASSSHLF